jgi:N-acetylglucosamine malate deacetylase 1
LSSNDSLMKLGVDHAEGFTVERYLAVNSLGDLI